MKRESACNLIKNVKEVKSGKNLRTLDASRPSVVAQLKTHRNITPLETIGHPTDAPQIMSQNHSTTNRGGGVLRRTNSQYMQATKKRKPLEKENF